MIINYIVLILFVGIRINLADTSSSRVLELSDKFLEHKSKGIWLIKFYAPWCGHCKKLEPVFNHVAQALHNTPVRVARIDCTRFPTVANEFGINSFPTIIFLKGDLRHVFKGDRTSEELINYAKRMSGPNIKVVKEKGKMDLTELTESENVIVGYVDENHEPGSLYEIFNKTAHDFQHHLNFYHFHIDQLSHDEAMKDKKLPLVFLRRDDRASQMTVYFDGEPEYLTHSNLARLLKRERWNIFVKVTRSNFQSLLETQKFIVLAIVEEDKLGRVTDEMLEFSEMINSVNLKNFDKYRENFQFGWVGAPELANSIAMMELPIPSLLVVNSTSYHHYIPEDDPKQLTEKAIEVFLDQLLNDSVYVSAYGGNTIGVRLYRSYYEAKNSLVDMWVGNPVLTVVLFGLPIGFLSLICYSICCADLLDDTSGQEEEEELLDDHHEKNE